MDEEKLIQVSFQIPPSALDSLSRLAEQLRLLTETANVPAARGRTTETEYMESESFDSARFLALQQDTYHTGTAAAAPNHIKAVISDTAMNPDTVRAAVSDTTMNPDTVHAAISDIGDATTVPSSVFPMEDAETVSAEVQRELLEARDAGDAAAVRSEQADRADSPVHPQDTSKGNTAFDAPGAFRTVERQIPDVESVRTEAEERELLLATARGEVSGGVEAPLGAGVVIQTQPEMPQSRWTDVTEELVIPGPAPLTAEAVSLAFERDGRRYDNGFPLY